MGTRGVLKGCRLSRSSAAFGPLRKASAKRQRTAGTGSVHTLRRDRLAHTWDVTGRAPPAPFSRPKSVLHA